MVLQLFDGSDSDNDNSSKIEINRDYAKKFEYNKKREDLHRLAELKKKGLVENSESEGSESESSSLGEEDEENTDRLKEELEFFNALIKVQKHDPTLKQQDVKLFDSNSSNDVESDDVSSILPRNKKKPMYLKDVVAKHLIEEGPEFVDEKTSGVKVYNEEQEEILEAFLEKAEMEDGEDEEELLKVKESGLVEEKDKEIKRKLDEYFGGEDDQMDEKQKFLKEYFMNKMWLNQNQKVDEEELAVLSEDEAEIEKQEEYEYRFQENAGDRIWGQNRTIEGSVRKKKSLRKEQRKSKGERMEIARAEREEELKHLKNLKMEEVKEKLMRIRETAGIGEDEACLLDFKDLDEDFNPEEYDKMMKKAFGEDYYEKEDVNPEFGSDMDDEGDGDFEKPNFDKEDELLGLPKGWSSCGSGDGFLEARQRSLKHKIDHNEEEEYEHESGEEEEDGHVIEEEEDGHVNEEEEEDGHVNEEEEEEGKRKRKRKLSLYKKAKEAMMEEYYKLDYEDTIGDLHTRFKYAKIKPNRYGLSTTEILALDEKELNQFVSLKKLAPYKEEWKMPNGTRQRMKMRTREILKGASSGNQQQGNLKKKTKNKNILDDREHDKAQVEDTVGAGGDKDNLSRKAKRRLLKAQLKQSHVRLLSFGKIASKSKKKRKHSDN